MHTTFLENDSSQHLTHSVPEYFRKLAFKKNKRSNFKRLYLKRWGEFRFKTNILRTLIQFSSNQRCFLHALPMWVHGRRLRPLQPPVPLTATRRTERVNIRNIFRKWLLVTFNVRNFFILKLQKISRNFRCFFFPRQFLSLKQCQSHFWFNMTLMNIIHCWP